jgi:glycosyltransferase involved in cell wall biosynthesis
MRILVVSQYYPPEAGATQNRLGSFVEGLVGRGHEVTVVCEQPNHPSGIFHPGFGRKPLMTEVSDGLTVHRLWVAASPRKTTTRRLAFYGTFAAGAGALVASGPRFDVAFASSPPLPGAFAAGFAAHARGIPVVVDVRDLWPAVAEALGELSAPSVMSMFEWSERRLYRFAQRVTATTRPFCRHIDRVAGWPISVHLPNGARDELLELPERAPSRNGRPFTIGYAGNLGIAQGLQIIFDAAECLRADDIRFLLVGDGPLAEELRQRRERRALDAIDLRPPVPVEEVGDILLECDALLVPLRRHPLLADFIPSKLYDSMAVGRPVILAATGEAASLVRDSGCGVVVEPENGAALADAARALANDPDAARDHGAAGRRVAAEHARSRQVQRLEEVLFEVAAGGRAGGVSGG